MKLILDIEILMSDVGLIKNRNSAMGATKRLSEFTQVKKKIEEQKSKWDTTNTNIGRCVQNFDTAETNKLYEEDNVNAQTNYL